MWWAAAKQFCDCIGSLVVLDTQEKYDHLMSQIGGLYVSVEVRLHQAKEFHLKYVAMRRRKEGKFTLKFPFPQSAIVVKFFIPLYLYFYVKLK